MVMVKNHPSNIAAAFAVLVALEAATFLVAAALHVGVRIPLGFATLVEPRIAEAATAEGLIGIFLAGSACVVFSRQTWAWWAAIVAHIFAVVGVTIGVIALTFGPGPLTPLNDLYHRVMLGVAVAVLVFLFTPIGRGALGRSEQAQERK